MIAMLRRDIAEVFQKNEPEIGRALSTHAASQQGKGWKGRGAAGDPYRGADRGFHGSFALSVIPNLFRDPWTQCVQARAMPCSWMLKHVEHVEVGCQRTSRACFAPPVHVYGPMARRVGRPGGVTCRGTARGSKHSRAMMQGNV